MESLAYISILFVLNIFCYILKRLALRCPELHSIYFLGSWPLSWQCHYRLVYWLRHCWLMQEFRFLSSLEKLKNPSKHWFCFTASQKLVAVHANLWCLPMERLHVSWSVLLDLDYFSSNPLESELLCPLHWFTLPACQYLSLRTLLWGQTLMPSLITATIHWVLIYTKHWTHSFSHSFYLSKSYKTLWGEFKCYLHFTSVEAKAQRADLIAQDAKTYAFWQWDSNFGLAESMAETF